MNKIRLCYFLFSTASVLLFACIHADTARIRLSTKHTHRESTRYEYDSTDNEDNIEGVGNQLSIEEQKKADNEAISLKSTDNSSPESIENSSPESIENSSPESTENSSPESTENSSPESTENSAVEPLEDKPKISIKSVPIPAPSTVISGSDVASKVPGVISITNENGCGGGCCNSGCFVQPQDSDSKTSVKMDMPEVNQTIQRLYDRAIIAKLKVVAPPEIKTVDEGNAALNKLESAMSDVKHVTSVPQSTSFFQDPSILKHEVPISVKSPRFIQNDDSDVEEALNEAEEAEEEAKGRENSLNDLETERENEQNELEEMPEEMPEEKKKPIQKTVSAGQARQLLETEIITLENLINDVVSVNYGVKDLLGTQQRINLMRQAQ